MKNLKILLRLATGAVATAGPISAVVACNNESSGAVDISKGINVSNLDVQANTNLTYNDLNNNNYIMSQVAQAINSAKGINVVGVTDFYLTNDQEGLAKQAIGATVDFTVHGIGDQIKGTFDFITTLTKLNISFGVTISDLNTQADPTKTYGDLTNDTKIGQAVSDAIYSAKKVRTILGTDFVLTTDQSTTAAQTLGKKVAITVTGTGKQVTGSFTFNDILGEANISDVTINNLQIPVDQSTNYAALNSNSVLVNAVLAAINAAKNTNATVADITLTNDQDPNGQQIFGRNLNVTATANSSSQQLEGSFNFGITLSKPSINNVTLTNPQYTARGTATYGDLNTSEFLKTQVVTAINNAVHSQIGVNDITLTNNQTATATQVPGQAIIFTVKPTSTTSPVTGQFQFTLNLGAISLRGTTVGDLAIPALGTQNYTNLNANQTLVNGILAAIKTKTGVTLNPTDITITNNQTGTANQVPGTNVTFTVTANSSNATDSFTFTNTLAKVSLNNVTLADPASAYSATTYANLVNSTAFITSIANAINTNLGTSLTANSITLSTTATGNIVPGTAVPITVTAKPTSSQVTGSFTFTDTFGQVNISAVTIADPTTAPIGTATYGSLNTQPLIYSLINKAIYNATGYNATAGTDYTVTNNQTATGTQTTGQAVLFTVTGIGKLTGTFTFTDTLTTKSLNGGIYVPQLNLTANAGDVFSSLNTNTTIINAVIAAINSRYNANVTATDFTITNNKSASSSQATGFVIFYVTASASSTQISGTTSFNQLLN